jgi:multidrug efflux system membrane fusion protein
MAETKAGLRVAAAWVLAAVLLAGCDDARGTDENSQAGTPARVTVLTVAPETVTLVDELPGRVASLRVAEIRPQVGGIIAKRLFEEGGEVAAGQVLFQIDPAPFQADVDSAAAALSRAEAGLTRARLRHDRATELLPSKAISREAYDDAVAELAQTTATVAEARATLRRRQLDLDFASVRAPISGRIGPALVSEGALVSAATPLAVVQQIDRVHVDLRQPAAQLGVMRAAASDDTVAALPVSLHAADGRPYPMAGRLRFADISVEPGTGSVTVRLEVPNAERLLLPGMYVRAALPRAVSRDALLVPQEAVGRDDAAQPYLIVVGAEKRGSRRPVELGPVIRGRYLVLSGLEPGETIVVQGQDRVQGEAALETTPYVPTAAGKS